MIEKFHSDPFTRGQLSATYGITVSNDTVSDWTLPVTVVDSLPDGLTLVSMEGDGWSCVGNVCTRTDGLTAGDEYPVIVVTVSVDLEAADTVTNSVNLSGDVDEDYDDITLIIDQPAVPARTPTRWSLHQFEFKARDEEKG